jgi:hypothetical protein
MALNDVYALGIEMQDPLTLFTCLNLLHFREGEAGLILDTPEEDLVGAFITECQTSYLTLVHGRYNLVRYFVKRLPADVISYEQAVTSTGGALGGDMLPPQISGVLSLRTANLSRRGRGRIYLPPTAEANSSAEGRPTGPFIAEVATFMSDLLEGMSDITLSHKDWYLGVWSREAQSLSDVTSIRFNLRWGTQRGRAR